MERILRDGAVIEIRPVEPGDAEALVRFHAGLSLETTRRRYFSPHPLLSDGEVHRFTNVDHHDREALVATCGTDLIGVARYERVENAPEAEIAFVVADAWHNHGIGTLLLLDLVERAREEGLARLVADTFFDNQLMIEVFEHSGFSVGRSLDHGVLHYVLTI